MRKFYYLRCVLLVLFVTVISTFNSRVYSLNIRLGNSTNKIIARGGAIKERTPDDVLKYNLPLSPVPCVNITSQPSTTGQTQCINGTFTSISVTATGTSLTYQWYSNTTNTNSGGTILSGHGASTKTYTPQATTAGILYYYCVITSSECGSATSNCSGAFEVDASVGGTVDGSSPICSGYTTNLSLSGETGTVSYWQYSYYPYTSWTNVTNTSDSYTSDPLTQNTRFRAVVQNGTCASANSISKLVVVNPIPTITNGSVSTPTCYGSDITFSATGLLAGVTNTFNATLTYGATVITLSENETSDASGSVSYTLPGGSLSPGTYTYDLTSIVVKGCTYTLPSSSTSTFIINQLPTPTISGSQTPCLNSTIIYTTESGMANYTWNVTGGTITSGGTAVDNTATIQWTSTGAQSVSVNYANTYNCTAATATVYNVTVNPLPVAGDITGVSVVCFGSTLQLSSNASGTTPLTYVWNSSDQTIATVDNTGIVTPVAQGFTNITYTVTDGTTCSATSAIFGVTVNPLPTPSFSSGATTVCAGSTVVYSDPPIINTYFWDVTGGTISGSNTNEQITVVWDNGTSGTVQVTQTDPNTQCSKTISENITISPLPNPTITGFASVCLNSTENYTTEPGMTGYTWNVTGGTITAGIGTNSITVTWNATGTQSVSVNYTNTNNCTAATATVKSVTVNTLPVPIISGPTTMCSSASGNVFTTQSGMSNYIWSVPGGTITAGSGTNSITATLIASGAQTVSVNYTDPNGCTAATATVYNVTVNGHTPVITGNPNNTGSVMVGDTDQYSTPLIPGDLYSWSASGEIGLCSGAKNCIIVHFVNPCCIYGVWTIYVTETNPSSGCSATSSKDVLVNP